jgi:hypothetical protein
VDRLLNTADLGESLIEDKTRNGILSTLTKKGRDQVATFQEALLERPGIDSLFAGRLLGD